MCIAVVDSFNHKMEYSIKSILLLNYAISKNSRKRYTRTLKTVLPRKKTSSKRIGKNYQWNLLEESSQRKTYHFSDLDFNNEINDNILNELRDLLLKGDEVCMTSKGDAEIYSEIIQPSSSHENVLHYNVASVLTPPITPHIEVGSFNFNSHKEAVIQVSASEVVDGLPLTPCDSAVFTY